MKGKRITLTGIAIILLVFTILFAGCFTFGGGPSNEEVSHSGGTSAPQINYVPDGTYTFYPRPRVMQGGVDKDFYLDRVTARSGTVTFYFTGRPLARGGDGDYGPFWNDQVLLTDLDRPSRTWNFISKGEDDDVTGGLYLTFQGVAGNRFGLSGNSASPPYVFEEIILSQPDVPLDLPPLKNGTYTVRPRLQANQGGVDKNVYLDRIVLRGGYFTMYFTGRSEGKGGDGDYGPFWNDQVVLQDLDHPQLVYNFTSKGEDDVTDGFYITFQGVTATRFSLTGYSANPPYIFGEIILGEPDA
jgi:hypothetical protein